MSEGQGADGGDDEQDGGQLHGDDVVVVERDGQQVGGGLGAVLESGRRRQGGAPHDGGQGTGQPQSQEDEDRAPHDGAGGTHRLVTADTHEHDDEQDEGHDGTGVDHDLGDTHEGRLVDDVEDGQRDHDADHVDGGVHGSLGGQDADAAGHGDQGDDAEDDGLAQPQVTVLSQGGRGDGGGAGHQQGAHRRAPFTVWRLPRPEAVGAALARADSRLGSSGRWLRTQSIWAWVEPTTFPR